MSQSPNDTLSGPGGTEHPAPRRLGRRLLSAGLPSFALAMLAALACRWAAGEGLGLFFGGVAVVGMAAPALVLAESTWRDRLLAGSATVTAVVLIWLTAVYSGSIETIGWLNSGLVLAGYAAAVGGMALALRQTGLPAPAAAALTVVAGLAWLSWPLWLSPWLTGAHREAVAGWLVAGHPLFAINGALLGSLPVPWPQYPIAYRLTSLGSDISYAMPKSILPCLTVHLLTAAALILPWIRRKPQPPEAGENNTPPQPQA